jgi:superoxide reductase
MAEKGKIYRCEVCGNVVMVLSSGKGELACCGKAMTELEEKTDGQGKEKHLPVINREGDYISVKVGEVMHPMGDEHNIGWILARGDDEVMVKYLAVNGSPEAKFYADGIKSVEAYCNLHGLWKQNI